MDTPVENVKIAVALRAARTALGWNQQEFADRMQVAKSTVARIETVEMAAKADFLTRALGLYREYGVVVDLFGPDKVTISVDAQGLKEATDRLENDQMRRSDRKGKVKVMAGPTAYEVKPRKKKIDG